MYVMGLFYLVWELKVYNVKVLKIGVYEGMGRGEIVYVFWVVDIGNSRRGSGEDCVGYVSIILYSILSYVFWFFFLIVVRREFGVKGW